VFDLVSGKLLRKISAIVSERELRPSLRRILVEVINGFSVFRFSSTGGAMPLIQWLWWARCTAESLLLFPFGTRVFGFNFRGAPPIAGERNVVIMIGVEIERRTD